MLDLDQVYQFAPGLVVERVGDDRLVFLSHRGQEALPPGRNLVEVSRLLDGRRSALEVTSAVRGVSDTAALEALHLLEEHGYLVVASSSASSDAAAFWHAMGAPVLEALQNLSSASVRIHALGTGVGPTALEELRRSLQGVGLRTASEEAKSDVDLWIVDDYLRPELEAANRRQLETRTTWCLVEATSSALMIGPVFTPGGTGPCYACLAHRLRGNRPIQEHLRRLRRQPGPLAQVPAVLPTTQSVALGIASIALAQAIANPCSGHALKQNVLSLDLRTLLARHHFVMRRPQCSSCGDPDMMRGQANMPVKLGPILKQEPHEGGYRQRDAGDTFDRFRRLVDPLTGAIAFLEPKPGRPSPLHAVYVSGYFVLPREGNPLDDNKRMCAGKGRSAEQAKASALCEALERRSGLYEGDEACVRGTLDELGGAALTPELLQGFSDRQYSQRVRLNAAAHSRGQWVPERLLGNTAIDWTPAWSLASQKKHLVPFSYCFAEAPPETGTAYCRASGNGVAAGTCLEEAVLQGLLELVERDAIAVWWYNRICRPAVDLSKVRDPYVDSLVAEYRGRGIEVWVLDLTHDLGIPVCAAVGRQEQSGHEVFAAGFGCHLRPELAIQRALTELNQTASGTHPVTGKPFLDTDGVDDRRYLFPFGEERVDPDVRSPYDGVHLQADIEECLRRLGAAELEAFVVNKTRPDLELSVAQVIVPGLRHFWPRFAPGRLYDVPVRLGWRSTALGEASLNPAPLLL